MMSSKPIPLMSQIVLRVLGKISSMLIQESDVLIGMEDHFHWIESELRQHDDRSENVDQLQLRETIYNIENFIDELIVKSAQKRKRSDALMHFIDLPKCFFYILAVVDLIDYYKLCKELEQLKEQIWKSYSISQCTGVMEQLEDYHLVRPFAHVGFRRKRRMAGEWCESVDKIRDLDIRSTTIFPTISKFEALATLQQLSPTAKKQARWLRDEFKSLHDYLEDVGEKEQSQKGMAWIEELREACWLSENIIGLFLDKRQQPKKLGAPIINFISQRKLDQKLSRIKAEVFDISTRRFNAIPVQKYQRNFSKFPFRSAAPFNAEQLHINSFDEDVDEIVAQLLEDDPRFLTISIVGAVGIGKTSLAKLIYDSQVIVDNFPHRAWVPGTSYVDMMRKIMGLEDSDLCFNPRNETEEDYKDRLRQIGNSFFMDKKYLIVIDDSYSSDFLIFIRSAFTGISTGTRILFTVRYQGLPSEVTKTNFNFTYRLHLRSDDESWSLFKHAFKVNILSTLGEPFSRTDVWRDIATLDLDEWSKVFEELNQDAEPWSQFKEISSKLRSQKQDILRTCGGLPAMIVELGRQFSWTYNDLFSQTDATLKEWSKILEHLNQDEKHWSQVLEDINKKLPLYLRRCLFYFGLFPARYKIPARRLIVLWVAEGLGRQNSDEKSLEYVAEACLTELVNYNMVQVTERKLNGKAKTCRLPKALRVHWFFKAKEADFLQGHSDSTPVIRRLADHLDQNDTSFDLIHGNNSNSLYPCYRNVVSFLSFDPRDGSRPGEDIENFLDRCISSNCFLFLWVLDLECVFKPKLPKAAAQLTRLRYLGLRSTYLDMLPVFINKLLNLQTLDLKRTCINTLPVTIWKMQKLRHLFLDENFRSMFVPRQVDDSLPDLQTLWGVFIDEDSPVKTGLDTLSNISKLGLKCKISVPSQSAAVSMSSQLVAVANWVHSLKNLQSLRMKSFDESGQPWDLYLESLSAHMDLSYIYLVGKLKNQNLLSELPHSLIELTLSASQLAEDPMQTLDKLPNLRILKLFSRSFVGKKMLCRFGGFIKLEVLKLWELELLDEWHVEEGAMPILKDLEIRRCIHLRMLPDGLGLVRTLRELKLTKVPELSSRIKDNQSEDWYKIAHVRHVSIQD